MTLRERGIATQPSARRGAAGLRAPGPAWFASPGNVALLIVAVAWAAGLALILSHRIFVTNDSLNNYAHVWYVSERIWHGHGVPLRMPVLGHGDAFAFPYAFVPWLSAALVRPLLGDWAVTLWLVVGFVAVVAAVFWAFPEVRDGWWPALVLANPVLVECVILGQLPFLWATALVFAAVGAWRRDAALAAALLLGMGQATHAAVMVPIAAGLVAARLPFERDRRRYLAWYALSLLIAVPAVILVLLSPSVGESTRAQLIGNFFATVTLRAVVVAAPFIAIALQKTPLARAPLAILAMLVALNIGLVPLRHNEYGWTAFGRTPDASLEAYADSPAFVRGATYRLLRVGDGKVGMYQLLRAGGRLDAEFFPESIGRRSWATTDDYAAFLESRKVDKVIIYHGYDARYRTNEHHLLEEMSQDPESGSTTGVCVRLESRAAGYDVYGIARCAAV